MRGMKFTWTLVFILAAGIISFSAPARAAVPVSFTYQGSLKQNGSPVNGTYSIEIRLTSADGNVLYWSSGPVSVPVKDGLYRVELTPTGIDWATATPYVETRVANTILLPREKLTSTPYAQLAKDLDANAVAKGNFQVTGTVAIGTGTTAARFHLYDSTAAANQEEAIFSAAAPSGQVNQLKLGYRNATPSLQSFKSGYGPNRLLLNPEGGNVGVNTNNPSAPFTLVKRGNPVPGLGDITHLFAAGYNIPSINGDRQILMTQYLNTAGSLATYFCGNGYLKGPGPFDVSDGPATKFMGLVFYDDRFGFRWNNGGIAAPAVIVEADTGNVGIGMEPPSSKLDVKGTITVHGAIRNEEYLPAFFVNVDYDEGSTAHDYLGCPSGYAKAGRWYVGATGGGAKGFGYTNGSMTGGWMCLCVAQ